MTTVLPIEVVGRVSHYGAGSRGYQMCLLGYAPTLMCVLVLASTVCRYMIMGYMIMGYMIMGYMIMGYMIMGYMITPSQCCDTNVMYDFQVSKAGCVILEGQNYNHSPV